MPAFNEIGIERNLDWDRIRKLFIIGLLGAAMTFAGDWLLGYGVADGSLRGHVSQLRDDRSGEGCRRGLPQLSGIHAQMSASGRGLLP